MQQPGGDQVAVEPVEGVADDGQFEVPGFRVEGLGVRRDRADVPGAPLASGRLSVAFGDHVADVSAVDGQSGEDDGHDAHG